MEPVDEDDFYFWDVSDIQLIGYLDDVLDHCIENIGEITLSEAETAVQHELVADRLKNKFNVPYSRSTFTKLAEEVVKIKLEKLALEEEVEKLKTELNETKQAQRNIADLVDNLYRTTPRIAPNATHGYHGGIDEYQVQTKLGNLSAL